MEKDRLHTQSNFLFLFFFPIHYYHANYYHPVSLTKGLEQATPQWKPSTLRIPLCEYENDVPASQLIKTTQSSV